MLSKVESESPVITNRFTSSDGTQRYLLCLHDGQLIESVLIPRDDRATFCISSQVGCALGCTFCLTGQLGLTRNLSVPEIVSQVELLARETTQRFSVVFMGMGEPFDNYDNVLHAIRILHEDHGLKVPMSSSMDAVRMNVLPHFDCIKISLRESLEAPPQVF